MIHKLITVVFCLFFASFVVAQNNEINIVPKPRILSYGPGSFALRKDTRILLTYEGGIFSAHILNDYLRRLYGFKLKIVNKSQDRNLHFSNERNAIIFLPVAIDASGGDANEIKREKYSLNIESDKVYIGGTNAGLFYAIQTFQQLLPAEFNKEAKIPVAKIVDSPRFPYRGMHLDVGRHFMPVEFVKKYIDLMSQYKLNYFHWHLTEDQGWRVEIKKYPKLTEVGSHRPETVKEKNLNPYIGDGTPEGGFYTQEQIKDVVAYAKARYITVIPEIELPGHSSAALAAYPEFGCKQDYNYKVQTTWGIFKEVYCPTEKTFSFLQDVISEVIDLFPDSPYIHIGGDEVLKTMWTESPEVKELMARENLKDVNEVQSYFVRRMEKFINSKGKKIIGWDEILEGGLAPNATVMSWRGIKGGIEAAKAHHDVIMTPTDYVYFDYGQGDPAYEPINIGSYVPLEKVYSFDPVPKELSPDEAKYIIGGQGNVWTEYMATPEKVEYMAFPRMLALAEDVWSEPENKNFEDFSKRLAAQLPRLDKQKVNYRIPEPRGLQNIVTGGSVASFLFLEEPVPGSKIYYTMDGTEPTTSSQLYEKAIGYYLNPGQRIDLKTIVVLPDGRKSSVYGATFLRKIPLEPVDLTDRRPGVTFALATPNVEGSSTVNSGETKALGFQQFAKSVDLKQNFALGFDGYINVPDDGLYEFQVEATWDSTIIVGSEKLIDSSGTKDRAFRSGIVPLRAGLHKISLRYNNRGDNPLFRIRWGIKGQGLRVINGGELFH